MDGAAGAYKPDEVKVRVITNDGDAMLCLHRIKNMLFLSSNFPLITLILAVWPKSTLSEENWMIRGESVYNKICLYKLDLLSPIPKSLLGGVRDWKFDVLVYYVPTFTSQKAGTYDHIPKRQK